MAQRLMSLLDPVVRHGIRELREGEDVIHTLREIALMAALIGAGASATQAIRFVERHEPALVGPDKPRVQAAEAFDPGVLTSPIYANPYMMGAPWSKSYGVPVNLPTGIPIQFSTGSGTW